MDALKEDWTYKFPYAFPPFAIIDGKSTETSCQHDTSCTNMGIPTMVSSAITNVYTRPFDTASNIDTSVKPMGRNTPLLTYGIHTRLTSSILYHNKE